MHWQYKYSLSPSGGLMGSGDLDNEGLEGWELVVVLKSGNMFKHVFKKPSGGDAQWEYKLQSAPTGGSMNVYDLEKMSREGWELVTMIQQSAYMYHIFKRQLGLYDLS